jgi:hypothetical protein
MGRAEGGEPPVSGFNTSRMRRAVIYCGVQWPVPGHFRSVLLRFDRDRSWSRLVRQRQDVKANGAVQALKMRGFLNLRDEW